MKSIYLKGQLFFSFIFFLFFFSVDFFDYAMIIMFVSFDSRLLNNGFEKEQVHLSSKTRDCGSLYLFH